jgi:hypothetical protein
MRVAPRSCAAISVCALLVLICACDKHHVGEMPEVQRERLEPPAESAGPAVSPEQKSTSSSTSPKPTPVEFFRATKPR